MKSLLLAASAVMIATVAQAETTETIYVTPGSVVQRVTKAPFKTVISGNEKLLVVIPGATNYDLTISANEPDGTIGGSDVVMIDDKGKVVEKLHVEVTPFGAPSATVRVFSPHGEKAYLCSANTCMNPSAANKGMGDADSVSVTRYKWLDWYLEAFLDAAGDAGGMIRDRIKPIAVKAAPLRRSRKPSSCQTSPNPALAAVW